MTRLSRLFVLPLLVAAHAAAAGAVPAQSGRPAQTVAVDRMALHAHTLRYRAAEDALEVVRPLLSSRGSAEVQADGNTLVIRDRISSLARIVPALRRFDRRSELVRLEVLVVRAARHRVSPPTRSTVPPELEAKLKKLLPFDSYELVAEAVLGTEEGESVTYEIGAGYSLRFDVGDLVAERQLRLEDFRVFQQGREEPLIRTNLRLQLDRTYSVGLAKSQDSPTALMIVLTCQLWPVPSLPPSLGSPD